MPPQLQRFEMILIFSEVRDTGIRLDRFALAPGPHAAGEIQNPLRPPEFQSCGRYVHFAVALLVRGDVHERVVADGEDVLVVVVNEPDAGPAHMATRELDNAGRAGDAVGFCERSILAGHLESVTHLD